MSKCSNYFCDVCNCYIFGGNGLREHRRSQKHAEALKSKIAPHTITV